MTTIPSDLADHLSLHHGVASAATLADFGLTASQIRSLVSAGLLVALHQHVYRLRSNPDTFEARCVAVSAVSPFIAVTGVSAGRLWGLRRLGTGRLPLGDDVIVAAAPPGLHWRLAGVRMRRSTDLLAADMVERDDGIRLMSPARTWFDLGAEVDDRAFESITEQVLDRYCSIPTLWAIRRRLAGRGRNGAARVNRVLDARSAWQRPADSDLEVRVLRAMKARGVELVQQHTLRLRNGGVIHLDAADPARRWGLEIDHVTWHGGRFDAQRDKARDRQARLLGWQIERVTDDEVRSRLERVVDELVELHDQARRNRVA
jgi:very-short-patch-repair endonuclease